MDQPGFRDNVRQRTERGSLMDPNDLFKGLRMCKHLGSGVLEDLTLGQVRLAQEMGASYWLKMAAKAAKVLLTDNWISTFICEIPRKQIPSSTVTSDQSRDYRSSVNFDHGPRHPQSHSPYDERDYSGAKRDWEISETNSKNRTLRQTDYNDPELDIPAAPMYESDREARYEPPFPPKRNIDAQFESGESRALYDDRERYERPAQEKLSDERWDFPQDENRSSSTQWDRNTRDKPLDEPAHTVKRKWNRRSASPPSNAHENRWREPTNQEYLWNDDRQEFDPNKMKKKRRKQRFQRCPIPGCGEDTDFLKQHLMHCHIPVIFDEHREPNFNLCDQRFTALTIMAKSMFGPNAKLDNLVRNLNTFRLISPGWEITKVQRKAMEQMCLMQQWKIPQKFSLEPMNSPAALIHWRALLAIVSCMPADLRNSIRLSFSSPKPDNAIHDEPLVKEDAVKSHLTHVTGYDSFFQLDLARKKLGLPRGAKVKDVLRAMTYDENKYGYHFNLYGCTSVFFDPEFYPSQSEIQELYREGTKVVLGAHPKMLLGSEQLERLENCLQFPQVAGLAIGLDHTEHPNNWPLQDGQIKTVLGYIRPEHVLVIHCQGMKEDPPGYEAYMRCLSDVRKILHPSQAIHLHGFNGRKEAVGYWLEAFPNVWFSVNNRIRDFDTIQWEAVKSIPKHKLLLESDGPLVPVCEEFAIGAPHLLGFVAEVLARSLGVSMKEVLQVSLDNAKELYCIRNP